jgi:type II secretory pathway component GspD/PulD (secretin)
MKRLFRVGFALLFLSITATPVVLLLVSLTATPVVLAQTKDQPKKGQAPPARLVGEPLLRIYPVPGGNAEALAKLLQAVYKDRAKDVRIAPLGTHQIAAWADPQTHIELAQQQALAAPVNEIIPLTASLEAHRVAATLMAMFGDASRGGPFIDSEGQQNALIFRGSAEQLQEIKGILKRLEPRDDATVRILTVERGSAATMADMMRVLLPNLRANPVKVVLPGDAVPAVSSKKAGPEKAAKPAITLTAFGNKLLVTTDDRDAMATVVALHRLLQTATGDADFTVIRLKHAKAPNIAQILDEAFNSTTRSGKGGGPGGFAGRAERIRIVADPATNSLLVKASPLDTFAIRSLIDSALDMPAAQADPQSSRPFTPGTFGKKKKDP